MPLTRTTSHRHHRGTAEIETMLVIPILLAILFLIGATYKLGSARMYNAGLAEEGAYRDATTANNPRYVVNSPAPLNGVNDVRPDLPLRMHKNLPERTVTLSTGGIAINPLTVRNEALFISPAWAYSAYPMTGDSGQQNDWFQTYVDEAHGSNTDAGSVSFSLGLADSFPP